MPGNDGAESCAAQMLIESPLVGVILGRCSGAVVSLHERLAERDGARSGRPPLRPRVGLGRVRCCGVVPSRTVGFVGGSDVVDVHQSAARVEELMKLRKEFVEPVRREVVQELDGPHDAWAWRGR